MENTDINSIWKKQDPDLNSALILKPENLENIKNKKVRKSMRKLFMRRITETSVFVTLIILLIKFMTKNSGTEYMSAGITLIFFSVIGTAGSVRQIITILRLNYSEPVTTFQLKLEKIRLYSLRTLQLLLMSIPFYMAYIIVGFKSFFGLDIIASASRDWLIGNIVFSILTIPLSLYFISRLNLKTKNNWLKRLITDNGGRQIDEAIRFIDEIEMFKE